MLWDARKRTLKICFTSLGGVTNEEYFYPGRDYGEIRFSGRRLLKLGADPEKVFDLFEGWLLNTLQKDAVFDELNMFVENGLTSGTVKHWLDEQLNTDRGELLYRLFNDYGCDDELRKYGINASDYVSRYVSEYGKYPPGYEFAEDDEEEEEEETEGE